VVLDGGRGTFDLRPQSLRPARALDPVPSEAAAQDAAASADGLCRGCRRAVGQWRAVLRARRGALNNMAVFYVDSFIFRTPTLCIYIYR
jgi:hypothetical protein